MREAIVHWGRQRSSIREVTDLSARSEYMLWRVLKSGWGTWSGKTRDESEVGGSEG